MVFDKALSILNSIFELKERAKGPQSDLVEICISAGIFAQHMDCGICERHMSLQVDSSKSDGYKWRCPKKCATRSVRCNSILEDCKLSLAMSLSIVKLFLVRCTPKQIMEIYKPTDFDRRSIYRLYSNLQVYLQHSCQLSFQKIGGFGEILEIDEMIWRKRKFQKGRVKITFWIVGIINRETDYILMFPVLNRKKETMEYYINKLVEKDSVIYSDQWSAYNWMADPESGYLYATVNHSMNYLNPGTCFLT